MQCIWRSESMQQSSPSDPAKLRFQGHMYSGISIAKQVASTERAMELGKEAAEYVSKTFVPPIKLEFEKVRPARHACADARLCSSSVFAV